MTEAYLNAKGVPMTDLQTQDKQKPEHSAHVTVSDGDKTAEKEIPSGPTVVAQLMSELGADPADTLFIRERGKKRPLSPDETVVVKSGEHFEVIRGGGVS
jgi:hypothetical protein